MLHVRRLIQQHFLEGLSTQGDSRMRGHLQACENCRSEYDRVAFVLRAASDHSDAASDQTGETGETGETGDLGPTRAEGERLWQHVAAEIDREPGSTSSAAPRRKRWAVRLLPAVMVLLLVASAVVLGIAVSDHSGRSPSGDKVLLRGGHGPTAARPALEIFAISKAPGDAGYETPRLLQDGDVIRVSDLLQFRYNNSDELLRYLYLFGVDERQAALDYYPRPTSKKSISIEHTSTMKSVGRSIRLNVRHRPGPLRVYAVFSRRPLSRGTINRTLASGALENGKVSATLEMGKGTMVVTRRLVISGKVGSGNGNGNGNE